MWTRLACPRGETEPLAFLSDFSAGSGGYAASAYLPHSYAPSSDTTAARNGTGAGYSVRLRFLPNLVVARKLMVVRLAFVYRGERSRERLITLSEGASCFWIARD